MAYDDDGTWNTVSASVPMGTPAITIAALDAAIKPTGNETLVKFVYNGELLDCGTLRFLVK